MQSSSAAGNQPDLVRIVLNHLSSSKSKQRHHNEEVRGLHRTSKHHQAAARATLRHLHLDKYYAGVVLTHPDANPDNPVEAFPWDLLAASPAVTSWTVHPGQLSGFLQDRGEQLAAAARNLKRLEVLDIHDWRPLISDFSLLLHACPHLQKVHITSRVRWRGCSTPHLLLDPASSSLSSAVCPALPLLSWESSGVPFVMMEHWLEQQQQQPGGTLTRLVMRWDTIQDTIQGKHLYGLAAVSGLRELQLDDIGSTALNVLHSHGGASPLPHLTRLCVPGEALEAACRLKGLQQLSLESYEGGNIVLSSSLSSMQQLTGLEVFSSAAYTNCIIPDDLGVWLPKLVRLEGFMVVRGALPASLTALTHLRLAGSALESPVIRLPCALPRLKELLLEVVYKQPWTVNGALTSVPALEVLEGIKCSSLAALQPLIRLRRLACQGVRDPATFTVLSHLQQLSCLDVAPMYQHSSALALVGPLPALQQLSIGLALEPVDLGLWLGQCTALTKLCVYDHSWRFDDDVVLGDLECLPQQLQELRLQDWRGPVLPARVMHLAGLTALYVAAPVVHVPQGWYLKRSVDVVCELPMWLSQLRRLELLDITYTEVFTEQPVLAHMPALRRVKLHPQASVAEVFGSALYLCYGGCPVPRE